MTVAKEGINRVWEFYKAVGMPVTLTGLGIEHPDLDKVANQATRGGSIGNFRTLTTADVKQILTNAL